jgi:hypothetical protein
VDPSTALTTAVRWAVQCLWLDDVAAEVTTALSANGVRSVLVKGPATARWLYPDDQTARHYRDVDLLVAPDVYAGAEEVLVSLGFDRSHEDRLSDEVKLHGHEWRRGSDGAAVDLHRSLHFLEDLPAEMVWRSVAQTAVAFEVAGVTLEAPSLPWRALHVVLHAAPEGPPDRQSWTDLARALDVVDEALWREAAALAASLNVEAAMGAGLRLLPQGIELAGRLGLPDRPPDRFVLRRQAAPPQVRSVARLAELSGGSRKARYVAQKLFPPPDFLRQWTPLASRSRLGLAAAYVFRLVWSLARLPPALVGWARIRRG